MTNKFEPDRNDKRENKECVFYPLRVIKKMSLNLK
jgi:hypothetical protein